MAGAAQRAVSRYFEWTESQRSVAKSMVVERARAGELELAPKWGDEELGAEDEDRIVDEKTRGELAGKMELRDLGVLDDMQELLLQLGYWDDEEGLQRIARMLKRGEQGRHNDFVDRKGWESDAMLIAELTDIAQLQTALIRWCSSSTIITRIKRSNLLSLTWRVNHPSCVSVLYVGRCV